MYYNQGLFVLSVYGNGVCVVSIYSLSTFVC